MSAAYDCCGPCPTVTVTEVPGSAGLDGAPGLNAYTVTVGDFIIPAVGANITFIVGSSGWMVVGQNIFVFGAGYFEVIAKPSIGSVTAQYLNYPSNVNAGNLVPSGSGVSPGGTIGSTVLTPGVIDPEGSVVGTPGQTYFNTTLSTFWIKASGVGNVGWVQLI
jgi:hypothetical protein